MELNYKIKLVMKKQWYFFLSLFFILKCFSQNENTEESYSVPPNFTPPNPQAFQFTKYGDLELNKSAGLLNYSIPLYTYKAGSISVPISLIYSSNGVKVDDDNGWIGMSWNLVPGGVITRTVNDNPDEAHINNPNNSRILYSLNELMNFSPNSSEELADLVQPGIDSEVDIFNFNFLGKSGSFYIDKNLNTKILKYDSEIKIDVQINSINDIIIVITDIDGKKYFFGGTAASESTRMKTGLGDYSMGAETSFYIYKIQDINGDEVYFNYHSEGFQNKRLVGYSQTYKKAIDNFVSELFSCLGPPVDNYLDESITNLSAGEVILETVGEKTLREISSNVKEEKVEFLGDFNSDPQINRRILNQIIVRSENEMIDRKFLFIYDTYHSTNRNLTYNSRGIDRKFLKEVKIHGKNNIYSNQKYEFEYKNPEDLPSMFSFSQDFFGYYNGKLNENFIPHVDQYPFNTSSYPFADRTPDFDFASKGVLNKIIYPTKGFTEIEYESGTIESEANLNTEESISIYYHPGGSTATKFLDETTITGNSFNTNNSIYLQFQAQVLGSLNDSHQIKISVENISTGVIELSETINLENTEVNSDIITKTYSDSYTIPNQILSPNNNYKFKIEYVSSDYIPIYPTHLTGSLTIGYSDNTLTIHDKPGIRVKRVKDYPSENSDPIVKRYYYNKYDDYLNQNSDSGEDFLRLKFVSMSAVMTRRLTSDAQFGNIGSSGCGSFYKIYKNISSSPLSSLYNSYHNNSLYKYITISSGGDNFENGGKQYNYNIVQNTQMGYFKDLTIDENWNYHFMHNLFPRYSNTGLLNGTLLQEKVLENYNGNLRESRIIDYEYKTLENKSTSILNCFTAKMYEFVPCQYIYYCVQQYPASGFYNYIPNYFIGTYTVYSQWYNLSKKKITHKYYENGLPDYSIQNVTEYKYDSELAGLPSQKIINEEGSDEVNKKTVYKYYYPQDINQPQMQYLINENRIGQPIKTETFINDSKISETKTKYVYDNENQLYLPQSFYSAKFPSTVSSSDPYYSNLDKQYSILRYNNRGKVQEVFKENGTHTVYFYGYEGEFLIAKIENASFTKVAQALGVTTDQLKNYNEENIQEINNLRSDVDLVESRITTYTFNPSDGITSQTNYRGKTIYFEYDDFHNLKSIKDDEGNFVKEYTNNFAN